MDSNNSAIQVFNYNSRQVRTVEKDGEVWFVAKDVCNVLGLKNPRQAIKALDTDERDDVQILDSIGRTQAANIVSEYGVYRLMMRSSKEEAKKFQRWLAHEVLPSIRKTGAYAVNGDVQNHIRKLEAENKLLHEKVDSMLEQPDRKRSAFLMGYQFDVPFTDQTRNRFRSVQNCRGNSEVRGTLGQYAIIPNDP